MTTAIPINFIEENNAFSAQHRSRTRLTIGKDFCLAKHMGFIKLIRK